MRTYVDWSKIYPKYEHRGREEERPCCDLDIKIEAKTKTQTKTRTKVIKKEWDSKPVTEDPGDFEGNYEEGDTEARSGFKVPKSDFEDRLALMFEIKPTLSQNQSRECVKPKPSNYYEPPFYAPHLPMETRIGYDSLRVPGPCSTSSKGSILNPWLNDKKYKN